MFDLSNLLNKPFITEDISIYLKIQVSKFQEYKK